MVAALFSNLKVLYVAVALWLLPCVAYGLMTYLPGPLLRPQCVHGSVERCSHPHPHPHLNPRTPNYNQTRAHTLRVKRPVPTPTPPPPTPQHPLL